jgi:hypothetical protein
MLHNGTRTAVLAAAVVGWSGLVAPRLSPRWLVPVHAASGVAVTAWTGAPLGLTRPAASRGARWGVAAAVAVSAVVASSTAVPAVRRGMAERELPDSVPAWLLVRIPIGTVWSEEAVFRAALGTVAAQAFGPRWGRLAQASAFGLAHVADARGAGQSVVGTVLVTGAAGWAFGWLFDRSGSLVAPMLAHLAVNESGALAALLVAGQTSRLST